MDNIAGLAPITDLFNPPQWADQFNTNFLVIQEHDHSANSGASIQLDNVVFINDFDCDSISELNYLSFSEKLDFDLVSTNQKIFNYQSDLYCYDGLKRLVQITKDSNVNIKPIQGGYITGDYVGSGAQITYASVDKSYTFTGAPNTNVKSSIFCYDIVSTDSINFTISDSLNCGKVSINCPSKALTLPATATNSSVVRGNAGTPQSIETFLPITQINYDANVVFSVVNAQDVALRTNTFLTSDSLNGIQTSYGKGYFNIVLNRTFVESNDSFGEFYFYNGYQNNYVKGIDNVFIIVNPKKPELESLNPRITVNNVNVFCVRGFNNV